MIFVTGGTGLVGAHILLKLSQQSKEFRALKRASSSLDVCKSIFAYYNADELFSQINWTNGDVNDIPSLELAMKGCDFLLHCAGLVSFSPSDIEILKKVNVEGTANVMNVALNSSIKKAGFVSSIAALGRNPTVGIVNEESYFTPTKTDSNYARSKYFSEQEVWRASAEGLDVVIINPSVILGPGHWKKGSSQIFDKIYKGQRFYAPGSSGYVDVNDVAESVIRLLFSNIKNQRFIVNGANLKYRDCFDRIAIALGRPKATIRVTPFLKEIAWRAEVAKSFITGEKPLITKETANSAMTERAFSAAKIEEMLAFQFTDIDVTIKKYANWFIADQS
tara:strand:- start:1406 stop:2410 length:1005 start_codon:yes stop_codon:yes gene_type:complete